MPSSTITSPYSHIPHRDRIATNISLSVDVDNFFKRTVFAGTKGAFDATMCIIADKLYQHLRQHITQYDFTNEQLVRDAIDRISFEPVANGTPTATPSPKRPARRRANPPLAVPPAQS